jgi:predicted anti-sigma-YlaC factor YlaD
MLTPMPPSECQRAREDVSAQLDRELSELGSARLSAHLRECDACAAYALEVAAITTRLRAAPLERPETAVVLPARRRRPRPALQFAAAAAVAGIAAASSLALGHALTSPGGKSRTVTHVLTGPSLQQEIVSQHILAMERHLPTSGTLRVGPLLAL